MARVNYTGIVDSITGAYNGSVFQKNKSGFIMRSTGATRKKNTTKQQIQHSVLMWWVKEWNLCTISEKNLWIAFASLHPYVNLYGRTVTRNCVNWFVSVNRTRQLCGVGEALTPPTYTLPDALPTYTMEFTDTTLSMEKTSEVSNSSQFLIVYSTPVLKNSSLSFNRFLRYQQIIQLYGVTTIDMLSVWELTHGILLSGVTLPNACGIGFRFVMANRSTGLQGTPIDIFVKKT